MKTAITKGRWEMIPCSTPNGILAGYSAVHYDYYHRIHEWMPLKLHLLLEAILIKTPRFMAHNRILGRLYSLIHGKICAYTTQEIKDFWSINFAPTVG